MSNIDKQALREAAVAIETVAIETVATPQKLLAFRVKVTPQVVLALLDENLQLQREKDAIEAVALALRDDMRQAREQLEAAEKRNAELERSETQLISERDDAESALNDAYKAVMGQAPEWSNWFSFENAIDEIELACELWRNQTDDVIQFRQRIVELEAKLETADRLQDGAFRDGLKAGFSYGQTDDQSGFAQCMSAYSTRAGIGVKQQEDSVDSDVSSRNQPGMVVAVHIDAGDFVKFKGQVFEVEETDFDDHDVTLWFVGGNALKCAAGCPVEVVSTPVAAGIKVKES
ncbi:ead/Ea22-like family protein [Salmonella enterica]|nr:ead/Ea22-like family protein [Salmonella enterica]EHF7839182.1 ead/Ea22-like family protein [Salmonella enterica]EHV0233160.1 ead/Ea22-like family protein [Salmonella enterica]EKG6587643.1 ead/Ea22-like family protein [Salmonella enterica]EKM8482962.1 ead/Ea22-like family protein [Salmonella enterica]